MNFKNASGTWLISSLFLETSYHDQSHVIYTLKDDDHVSVSGKKLPSLKRLYLMEGDPTEYQFAVKHLGGWSHWKVLSESPQLQKYIEGWREELEVKLRSEGVLQIIKDASDGDSKTKFSSAKYVADKGWEKREAGRPTKKAVEAEKKRMASVTTTVMGDLKRIKGD